MEVQQDTHGKFIVSFNGLVYNSCLADSDCPGQLVCAFKKSWSALPEMCICPTSLGRTGVDCDLTSPSGWILIVISCVTLLLALAIFLINVRNIVKVLRTPMIRQKIPVRSALFTTIIQTTVASLAILLQATYQIASHFVPRNAIVFTDGQAVKQSVLFPFNVFSFTLNVIFSITAALNISLVLIEIADRVSHGQAGAQINVFTYRKFLIGFSMAFGLTTIIFTVIGHGNWVSVLVGIAGILVTLTFLLGYFRIRKIYKENARHTGESNAKVNTVLRGIQIATLGISLGSFGMCLFGVLNILMDNYNTPNGAYGAIPGRLLWIFSALGMAFLTQYTHDRVRAKPTASHKDPNSGESSHTGGGGARVNPEDAISGNSTQQHKIDGSTVQYTANSTDLRVASMTVSNPPNFVNSTIGCG